MSTTPFSNYTDLQSHMDLETLRKRGWSVAVHNDYNDSEGHKTFWLFTHPNGQWLKGEGKTDDAAIHQCIIEAERRLLQAFVPDAKQELLAEAALILEQEGWLVRRISHENSSSRLARFSERCTAWETEVTRFREDHPDNWPAPPDNS